MKDKEETKAPLLKELEEVRRRVAELETAITERKQAEDALRNIAQGVSATTGEAFFHSLVQHLAKALHVEYAFVGELEEEKKESIKTIAVFARGEIAENFEYDLTSTPCWNVVGKSLCSYTSGVRQQFPDDHLLVEMGVESYVGIPLFDSAGNAHGLMTVMDRKPMSNQNLVESMLRIFAVRASAEMERQRADEELQRNYDTQTMLNALLHTSLLDTSLEEQLRLALEHILSITWLAFEKRGSIFLVEDEPEVLVMKAQSGLTEPHQKTCTRIPFGKCLCGRAASTREIQFAERLDDRHEIRYEGIVPHGHYCVPILSADRVLGVINMYLQEGHRREQREEEFLTAVANTVAGIIERKRAEESLRQSQQNYEGIINSIDGIVWEADARTFQFSFVSEQTERLLGYPSQRWLLEPTFWKDHIHPADREWVPAFCAKAIAEKRAHEFEYRMITADGRTVWLRDIISVVVENNQPVKLRGIMVDITQRKRAEEETQKSKDYINSILNNSIDMIFTLKLDGAFSFFNRSLESVTGYKEEELVGRPFLEYVVEEERPGILKSWEEALRGIPGSRETRIIKADGDIAHVLYSYSLLAEYDEVLVVMKDITERKRAEEALEKLSKQNKMILDAAGEGIYGLDLEGKTTFVNPAAARMIDWEPDDLLGQSQHDVLHHSHSDGTHYEREKCPIYAAFKDGKIRHVDDEVFWRKDGSCFPVEYISTPIRDGQGRLKGAVVTFNDITERKQAEKALVESEASLIEAQRIAHLGNWDWDIKNNTLHWSDEIYRIFDLEPQKFSATYEAFLNSVHPDDREFVQKSVDEALYENKPYNIEHRVVLPDGSVRAVQEQAEVTLDQSGKPVRMLGAVQDITERKKAEDELRESEERYRTILTLGGEVGEAVIMLQDTEQMSGVPIFVSDEWLRITGYSREELLGMSFFDLLHPRYHQVSLERHQRKMSGEIIPGLFEVSIIRKDGTEVPVELTSAHSTYRGKRVNVAFIRNITERKKMEEQLIVTDRLASIGELVAGVAHELNNPLTGIIGLSELVLDRDLPADVKEDLEVINREAQRTAQIVKNLLTFARQHPQEKQSVNINSVIEKVLEMRAYEQKVNNIEVDTRFAPDLPEIMADGFQLQQVFLNIVINAEHFMTAEHGRGTLTITTERVGDIVRASFADDGPGIARENIGHLFDPFFTTKEVGKGTGLGLSISYGIITEHGGQIYAESEPGKGATFIVELPVGRQ